MELKYREIVKGKELPCCRTRNRGIIGGRDRTILGGPLKKKGERGLRKKNIRFLEGPPPMEAPIRRGGWKKKLQQGGGRGKISSGEKTTIKKKGGSGRGAAGDGKDFLGGGAPFPGGGGDGFGRQGFYGNLKVGSLIQKRVQECKGGGGGGERSHGEGSTFIR